MCWPILNFRGDGRKRERNTRISLEKQFAATKNILNAKLQLPNQPHQSPQSLSQFYILQFLYRSPDHRKSRFWMNAPRNRTKHPPQAHPGNAADPFAARLQPANPCLLHHSQGLTFVAFLSAAATTGFLPNVPSEMLCIPCFSHVDSI